MEIAVHAVIQFEQLRAQAGVALLALQKLEDKLATWELPRASQRDSLRQAQKARIESQLHETKLQLSRLLLELDRAELDGRW